MPQETISSQLVKEMALPKTNSNKKYMRSPSTYECDLVFTNTF